MSDPMDLFENWTEAPEDTYRPSTGDGDKKSFLQPPVWFLAEIVSAEARLSWPAKEGSNKPYPVVNMRTKILRSQPDADGVQAKGTTFINLGQPPRGTFGDKQGWKVDKLAGLWKKGCIILLAPQMWDILTDGKEDAEKIARRDVIIQNLRPQVPGIFVGKQLLIKYGIDNGKNKEGKIFSQAKAANPKNEVDNLLPVTEEYLKYLDTPAKHSLSEYLSTPTEEGSGEAY